MIPRNSTLRVARPTNDLDTLTNMYINGLGFELLCSFTDHEGFSGTIIGHPAHPYHLEFTHHYGSHVGPAPSQDNLLVFYVPDESDWKRCCQNMLGAGFQKVTSFNPYWENVGCTFEDIDGYRVVLQRQVWEA